ncbi:uncharacterized protein VP01_1659g5 [Puccinia sorghi]|uniref:Integrase catalytic domain-containing protein n=1 Tax=Puccinia sorghi TaxID=27349 RepID=A0A0L6VGE8_9BASI|nr:uncharacterized protein VP01_1659g5 [Puccinia sorghi]
MNRSCNLYYLPAETVSSQSASIFPSSPVDNSLLGYHNRLFHIGLKPLKHFLKTNGVTPTVMNEVAVQQCQICIQSKMPRKIFKSRQLHRSTQPGHLIHSDVGSYEVLSREGYKYFVTFIDDYSKFMSVFPMKFKSDTFNCFKLFRSSFEKLAKCNILALRTDNGGEYLSNDFSKYLTNAGISHEPASAPKSFWADALRHAIHGYNSIPCKTPTGFQSPITLLGLPPLKLHSVHPFGCLAWYKVPEADRKSLDVKARASMLLSYLSDGNGFRLLDLDRRQVIKSRDVSFNYSIFPYGANLSSHREKLTVEVPWPVPCPPSPPLLLPPAGVSQPDQAVAQPQPSSDPPVTTPPAPNNPPLDIPLKDQLRFGFRLAVT